MSKKFILVNKRNIRQVGGMSAIEKVEGIIDLVEPNSLSVRAMHAMNDATKWKNDIRGFLRDTSRVHRRMFRIVADYDWEKDMPIVGRVKLEVNLYSGGVNWNEMMDVMEDIYQDVTRRIDHPRDMENIEEFFDELLEQMEPLLSQWLSLLIPMNYTKTELLLRKAIHRGYKYLDKLLFHLPDQSLLIDKTKLVAYLESIFYSTIRKLREQKDTFQNKELEEQMPPGIKPIAYAEHFLTENFIPNISGAVDIFQTVFTLFVSIMAFKNHINLSSSGQSIPIPRFPWLSS